MGQQNKNKKNIPQIKTSPHHTALASPVAKRNPQTPIVGGHINKFNPKQSESPITSPKEVNGIHEYFSTSSIKNNNIKMGDHKRSSLEPIQEDEEENLGAPTTNLLLVREEENLCEKRTLSALSPRVLNKKILKIRNHADHPAKFRLALIMIENVFQLIPFELSELTDEEYRDSMPMIIELRKFYNHLKKKKSRKKKTKLTLMSGSSEKGDGHHRKTTSMFSVGGIDFSIENVMPTQPTRPTWWDHLEPEPQEIVKAIVGNKTYSKDLVNTLSKEAGLEPSDAEEFCQWWFFGRKNRLSVGFSNEYQPYEEEENLHRLGSNISKF